MIVQNSIMITELFLSLSIIIHEVFARRVFLRQFLLRPSHALPCHEMPNVMMCTFPCMPIAPVPLPYIHPKRTAVQ